MHDSQVDLSISGISPYKDKKYTGAHCKGINAARDKASRKRSPGERPYSVMKGTMHGIYTFVTMARLYKVKTVFLCFGYNALTMITLKKHGKIA